MITRKHIKARHRAPPKKNQAFPEYWDAAQLFEDSLAFAQSLHPDSLEAVRYSEDRIGAGAMRAIMRGQFGVLPTNAHWRGYRLSPKRRFVLPLYMIDGQNALVTKADQRPVDVLLRAHVAVPRDQRMRVLPRACPNTLKTFGLVGMALCDSDGCELVIVEGGVNFQCYLNELWPSQAVLGIHGACTTERVCTELETEILLLRLEGVSGPRKIVIDTDNDETGNKAALAIAMMARRLGIAFERVSRRFKHGAK